MLLTLHRRWFTNKSTIGLLDVDGMPTCFTLEDVARPDGVKIPGETCIQAMEYSIIIDQSTRFGRLMPHILGVPMFSGIRIHAGNTSADTAGCILVGSDRGPDSLIDSRKAFDPLFEKLQAAYAKSEPICIDIRNEPL